MLGLVGGSETQRFLEETEFSADALQVSRVDWRDSHFFKDKSRQPSCKSPLCRNKNTSSKRAIAEDGMEGRGRPEKAKRSRCSREGRVLSNVDQPLDSNLVECRALSLPAANQEQVNPERARQPIIIQPARHAA